MLTVFNRPDAWGATANVGLALTAIVVANAIIFSFGAGATAPAYLSLWFAPPGWLVAVVWIAIFVLWSLARWSVVTEGARGEDASWWVVVLACSALLYPIRTNNFELGAGAVENAISLAFLLFVTWRVSCVSRRATLMLVPSIAWSAFANVLGWAALANVPG